MATNIVRNKSGRIISRKKFTPGTKSSPFFNKKKKSSSKNKPSAAEVKKFQDQIFSQSIAAAVALVKNEQKKSKQKTINNRFSNIASRAVQAVKEEIAKQKSKGKIFTPSPLQVKNIVLTAEQKQLQSQGQSRTPQQIKQFTKRTSKETTSGRILKELTPFVNPDSKRTYNKVGTSQKFNKDDVANILFDLVSVIPGAGLISKGLGKLVKVGSKTVRVGNTNKLISISVVGKTKRVGDVIIKTGTSIIKDIGATKRVTEGAKEYFNVNENLLNNTAKDLGFKNEKGLYNSYIGSVGAKTKDGKFKTDDVTNFLGIDYYNKATVKAGQREFNTYLLSQGLSQQQSNNIINNLEQFRKARQFGQLFGITKIEVSSERLAQNLIKKGVGKKTAVGLAGAREGVSTLLTEGYIQGYSLNPADFALAILTGVTGSIFFSKTKLKDIKPKDLNKAQNKITNKIYKELSPNRKSRYLTKLIKANSKKLDGLAPGTTEIKSIKKVLSNSDKTKLIKSYVKQSLVKSRGKIPTSKNKLLLRDPIANIIDPFEIVGDTIVDITDAVSAKVKKKLSIRKSKIKRVRVKTKVFTKSKSSTKAATSTKTKGSSNVASKNKAASKVTTKTKSKVATKSKIKIKTKSKVATKSKIKIKTKSKVATKSKSKVTTVPFPVFKLSFDDVKGNKKGLFVVTVIKNNKRVIIGRGLTKNRALKLAASSKFGQRALTLSGLTTNKDIMKPSTVRRFTQRKAGNTIKLILKR